MWASFQGAREGTPLLWTGGIGRGSELVTSRQDWYVGKLSGRTRGDAPTMDGRDWSRFRVGHVAARLVRGQAFRAHARGRPYYGRAGLVIEDFRVLATFL